MTAKTKLEEIKTIVEKKENCEWLMDRDWIWIIGDTKPIKEELKQAGCYFAPKKKCWFWKPGNKTPEEKGNTQKPKKKGKDQHWAKLHKKAHEAGKKAADNHKPTPMVVGHPAHPLGNDVDPNQPTYHVPEGVCGFAWVVVKPGNCPFANWLKKNEIARPHYQGGVAIWVREYGQSYERKLIYAQAYAKVIQEEGINARADGRLD